METRHQRLIREALEHNEKSRKEKADPALDLQDISLAHTKEDYVPRTLTPHEWERYYNEFGVPAEHKRKDAERALVADQEKRSWWRRLLN
ncbi:MAG: hypothetical protein AAF098_15520 [Pseudomonadota bacterium]